MSDDSSREVPPTPSTWALAMRAGQALTAEQRAVREFQIDQALETLEALRLAHNALALDTFRKSTIRSWKWLFVVCMTALATPAATDLWGWLRTFHH